MKLNKSFSSRLSLYVLSITAVLFIIAMLVVAVLTSRLITDEAKRSATNKLNETVGKVEKILKSVESATDYAAWIVKEHRDDSLYMYHIADELVKNNENIISNSISFAANYYPAQGEYYSPYVYKDAKTGTIWHRQLGNSDYDYFSQEWYQLPVLLKHGEWSEPYYGGQEGTKVMMVSYSVPVFEDNGEIFAVISSSVSLRALTNIMMKAKPYENSYVVVSANNGSFIVHPDSSYILRETLFSISLEQEDTTRLNYAKKIVNHQSGVFEYSKNGDRKICIFGPISNGWGMSLICSYHDVLSGIQDMYFVLSCVLLAGLLLLFLGCVYIIRKITQPLVEFSGAALQIAEGNFNTTLPQIHSEDEMRLLHDSFLQMQTSLVDYISELKSTTAEKERIESELNIARDIQMGMLPVNFPEMLYATLHPAKEVGGDLYDFIIRDNYLYFAIGDVSGKGVPAALFMSVTRSSLRFMTTLDLPLGSLVSKVNNTVNEGNASGMFVTLFVGKLNLTDGHLDYCNAGHNPIALVRSDGKAEFLHAKANLAAGVFPDFDYSDEEITMTPGSRLVLYTDGVTEAERSDKEQYGEERLLTFLSGIGGSPREITESLLTSVKQFTADAVQNDDITIMTIEYGKTI